MTDQTFFIDGRKIGGGCKPFIIAEVAQAHDGSLGYAHAFIDAAAQSGADAIKFQTHIAAAESTKDEKFRIPLSGQDETRYEYWKRMEFTPEQWTALRRHAHEKGLVFLSSAFSMDAFLLLEKLGMPAWKVGSGEFKSKELLAAMMATGKPVLFSTGMSTYGEVSEAVSTFKAASVPFALFQCTSHYPTALENVGLNVLDEYKAAHGCPVGLSDHSGTPFPALAAMAGGCDLIELHVTFDKRMYGPDTVASVTFEELSFLQKARDAFYTMHGHPVNKDDMARDMGVMRGLFTKSIGLKAEAMAGDILCEAMLSPKKPGTGIPYDDRQKVIGRTLKRAVSADRLLTWEDLNDEA